MTVTINENLDLNKFSLTEKPEAVIPTFPIDGLPTMMQDLIKDCSTVYQSPIEFWGMSFLMATSGSLKNRVYLQTKYKNYPMLWGMLVAPSGIGKSEPITIAFAPIERGDSDAFKTYQNDLKQHQQDCVEAKKDKRYEPQKPFYSQSIINDTTPEALFAALYHNKSLTLCRDELSGWFADFGRYAKSGEIAHYLSVFNNKQVKINRKQSEPLLIDNPFLNIFGGIQPSVLSKTFNADSLTENGMIQRFLFVYPDEVKKAKFHNAVVNDSLISWYDGFITEILEYSYLEDMHYHLSVAAEALFVAFSDTMTDKVNDTPDDYLKSVYSKMEIHLLRLALTVYMAKQFTGEHDGTGYLDEQTMEYSIRLCEYFIYTAEKVYSLISQKQPKKLGSGDLISELNKVLPIQNKAQFAESLGVNRSYITKVLK